MFYPSQSFEDDDIVFDPDDPDFIPASPKQRLSANDSTMYASLPAYELLGENHSHCDYGGGASACSYGSFSSSCFSIPEEDFEPDTCSSYPCPTFERSGIHARSLPVLIPNGSHPTRKMRQAEVESHSNCSSPCNWYSERGALLEDIRNQYHNTQTMLTIEELKNHYNSCFTCGVSWSEDHVSLDCFECGGYSMTRPCPVCDGKCNRTWTRDLTMSHAIHKAHWEGQCGLPTSDQEALFFKNLVDATEESITEALKDLKASS